MKKGIGSRPAAGSHATKGSKGFYGGEARTTDGYVIDKGGQYIMRTGFDPNVVPIGGLPVECSGEFEGLLDGVGTDLVRRSLNGRYEPVGMNQLWGRSVALLFSTGAHPKCASFIPFLVQYYKNINESGERPKIEIIYISLDNDEATFEESRAIMPWLSLQFHSPMRDRLIKRYRMKVEPQGPAFLPGRVTIGLPRLLVVGPRGEEMHWLPCDHVSAVVLKEWDFVASQWRPTAATVSGMQAEECRGAAFAEGNREAAANQPETAAMDLNSAAFSWPFTPETAACWAMQKRRREEEAAQQRH